MTHDAEKQDKQAQLNLDMLLSCSMGLTERVIELVAEGADLFTTHSDGKTALHYAAAYGFKDLLEYCLEQGMPVDRPDAIGRTPLFNAVENSRPEMIHLLIKAGANPDYRDHEGKTPLHLAAQFSRVESAGALLRHPVDPLLKDNDGNTPLDIARTRNNPSVSIQLLHAISLVNAKRTKQKYRGLRTPRP